MLPSTVICPSTTVNSPIDAAKKELLPAKYHTIDCLPRKVVLPEMEIQLARAQVPNYERANMSPVLSSANDRMNVIMLSEIVQLAQDFQIVA